MRGQRRWRRPGLPAAIALLAFVVACGAARAADPFPAGWPLRPAASPPASGAGMVVSADSLATAVGSRVLAEGGNAVDAAVAVHFALAVTYPRAGNLGGGGFLVLRTPGGEEAALDFREVAPAGATEDMYLDEKGDVTPESWVGHLASGVPGSVAGMAAAHRRYGSLPWRRLVEPAVALAEEGFHVDASLHRGLADAERLRGFDASSRKWLPGGSPPPVGTLFRQPELARALGTIAAEGPEAFYRGWIADSLAAEMRRGGGLIDREDLAAYEAVWREPIAFRYRDRRLVSMPPPSSGGVTLAEIFQVLEGFRLDTLGFGSADAVHLAVEAFRRAYADRNYWLGDPDFVEIPLERLTSQTYADSLRSTIRRDRASPSERFGRVPRRESRETTHYSIVDGEGMAVAVTTTLNGLYGSGVTVRGAGFLLNNEMDDFTAKPGVPNEYGLVQGEANAVAPGKRMLSSMSPTLVIGPDGRTELVTGSPGGATIITTVFQVVSNVVDHGMTAAEAVAAPRVHHQHLPDVVRYEPDGLADPVVSELRRRGHRLSERDGWSGNASTVGIGPAGTAVGVADPRRGGEALAPQRTEGSRVQITTVPQVEPRRWNRAGVSDGPR